jgi:hypothetical protein
MLFFMSFVVMLAFMSFMVHCAAAPARRGRP